VTDATLEKLGDGGEGSSGSVSQVALFDPRQREGSFNDHMTPRLRFNGTDVPLS
jgi:hypothetical protein